MIRFLLIACVIAVGCDRADELIAAAVLEALAEPPKRPTGHAADCAKGADRMAAPGVALTVHCQPTQRDGGVR